MRYSIYRSYTFDRKLPEGHIWMQDAKLKNSILCFPLKRNIYGKIFGGYLMRSAFETAWANAATVSHSRTRVIKVDNIMFRRPVEVGSLLMLSSQVQLLFLLVVSDLFLIIGLL